MSRIVPAVKAMREEHPSHLREDAVYAHCSFEKGAGFLLRITRRRLVVFEPSHIRTAAGL
jgi:hypothetical protein